MKELETAIILIDSKEDKEDCFGIEQGAILVEFSNRKSLVLIIAV